MSFLRRLLGSAAPTDGVVPPVAPPPKPVMDQQGVIYVGIACPYCGVAFDGPPGSTRKCPACGQHVIRDRSALDDLVRLIREDEMSDAAYRAVQHAKDRQYQAKDSGPRRQLNSTNLRTYAALGLHVVILNGGQDRIVFSAGAFDERGRATAECKPCRGLNRTTYPASRAPLLPLAECQSRPNRICNCRYQPFLPLA